VSALVFFAGGFSGPGANFSGPGGRGTTPMTNNGGLSQGVTIYGPGSRYQPPPQQMPEIEYPKCDACGKDIMGETINAANKKFHPQHFVCEICSQPFPGGRFIDYNGKLFCEVDYFDMYSKKCQICKELIRGETVDTGEGIYFHPQHFCCVMCGLSLPGVRYKLHPETKESYCNPCWEKLNVRQDNHMCSRCKRPIIGKFVLMNGLYLHPEHYRCVDCGIELSPDNVREHENDLYCLIHYAALFRKICNKCQKPIVGRLVTALGKTWHPEHFNCTVCSIDLNEEDFYENEGKQYCKEHYVLLFGKYCATCGDPILRDGIIFMEKDYHIRCFKCTKCEDQLKDGRFIEWDSQPMCIPCYDKLPSKVRKQVEKRKKGEQKAKKEREKN